MIGDVGSVAEYHVGDDAMLFGLLAAAEHAGIEACWTVVSAAPDSAAARFGHHTVPTFGFEACPDEASRAALLAELDLLPVSAPGPGRQLREATRTADAVVIAGGGNLSMSWPPLVYERVALSRLARRLGLPVVLTGQSIGPRFGSEVRPLVAELLGTAAEVGVRERGSHALAQLFGVPDDRIALGGDDAAALAGEQPPAAGLIPGPFIAVTLNDLGGTALAAVAAQLAELSHRTGAAVVLVPHVGQLDGAPTHDVAVAQRVAAVIDARLAELGDGLRAIVVPLPSAAQAVWYCQRAELVISSRYHPVVFAAANRTPMLFLYQDDHTAMKGVGALTQYGMAGWRLQVTDCLAGRLLRAATQLWEQRGRLAALLPEDLGAQVEARLALLVTRLAKGVFAVSDSVSDRPDWMEQGPPSFVELWEAELAAALRQLSALRQHAEAAEQYALSLQQQAELQEPYVLSLLRRAEIAEEYAASLLGRAETAEQYAATLETRLGERRR